MNLMVAAGCIVASALFQVFVFLAGQHDGNHTAVRLIIVCAGFTYFMYFLQLAANGADSQLKGQVQALALAFNVGAMIAGILAYIFLVVGG